MIYLHFVRHGETIFNVYHRMQGWCDTPLTAKGMQQAKDVAKGLRLLPYANVYCSDSGRAMETARFIAIEKGLRPIAMKEFREMFFGTMEGLDTKIGRLDRIAYREQYGWVDEGGENRSMLQERLFEGILSILPNSCHTLDEHIIIVSHGLSITSLIHRINQRLYDQIEERREVLENASVTTITYENGTYEIKDFNNTMYLENGRKQRNEKNYE